VHPQSDQHGMRGQVLTVKPLISQAGSWFPSIAF
jgi:hypothetical protein